MSNNTMRPSVRAISAELSPEYSNLNNETLFGRATAHLLACGIKPWIIESRADAVAILRGLTAPPKESR